MCLGNLRAGAGGRRDPCAHQPRAARLSGLGMAALSLWRGRLKQGRGGVGAHRPPQACLSAYRERHSGWSLPAHDRGWEWRPRPAWGSLCPAHRLPGGRLPAGLVLPSRPCCNSVPTHKGLYPALGGPGGMMSLVLPAKARRFSGNWPAFVSRIAAVHSPTWALG